MNNDILAEGHSSLAEKCPGGNQRWECFVFASCEKKGGSAYIGGVRDVFSDGTSLRVGVYSMRWLLVIVHFSFFKKKRTKK